jgi:hypothetical protein
MAPFDHPKVVLSGLKEKIDSLVLQGLFYSFRSCGPLTYVRIDDKLYLGTATGNLHVYSFDATRNVSSF